MAKAFVHESSYVESGATIGEDTRVWNFCHIMPQAVIGTNCNLGQNVFVDNGAFIGNYVKIGNNVSVYRDVTLEDGVFCGSGVLFTNVKVPRSRFPRELDEYEPTLVREGASIGANATIICGNTIGKYAMVAAGAIVTHDVPDYALVVGCPAKVVGRVDERGNIVEKY